MEENVYSKPRLSFLHLSLHALKFLIYLSFDVISF